MSSYMYNQVINVSIFRIHYIHKKNTIYSNNSKNVVWDDIKE